MKPGRHAGGEGSFGGSASAAGGRGFALIAVALLLGTLVLSATDEEPPGARVATTGSTVTTSERAGRDPTTTLPTVTTTLPLRPPAEVKVLVANATRTKGAAGRVSDQLRPPGYNVLAPTDATAAEASSVFHEAGFEREAQAVAQLLQLPPAAVKPLPTPVPVKGGDIRGANVVVVAGPELVARVVGTATTARAGTATTARTSTSTTARATSTTARATTTTARAASTTQP